MKRREQPFLFGLFFHSINYEFLRLSQSPLNRFGRLMKKALWSHYKWVIGEEHTEVVITMIW